MAGTELRAVARRHDSSPWANLRLLVHRAGDKALVTVFERTWHQHRNARDRMLARAVIQLPPGSEASRDPLLALAAALAPLLGSPPSERSEGPAAPQGPTGVVCEGQLRLDLPL